MANDMFFVVLWPVTLIVPLMGESPNFTTSIIYQNWNQPGIWMGVGYMSEFNNGTLPLERFTYHAVPDGSPVSVKVTL